MRTLLVVSLLSALLLTGCYQGPGHTRAAGAVAGTAIGATVGGLACGCGGALAGGVLGLAAGTIVGEGIAYDQERCGNPPYCCPQPGGYYYAQPYYYGPPPPAYYYAPAPAPAGYVGVGGTYHSH